MPNFRNISIVAAALLAATMPSSIHARGSRGLKKAKKNKSATVPPTDVCEKIPDLTFKEMTSLMAPRGWEISEGGYNECGGEDDWEDDDWGECTYKHFLVHVTCGDNRYENFCEADLLKFYQVHAISRPPMMYYPIMPPGPPNCGLPNGPPCEGFIPDGIQPCGGLNNIPIGIDKPDSNTQFIYTGPQGWCPPLLQMMP